MLTQSGGILWKQYFPNFAPFEHFNTVQVPLFHIRSAAHYTHQPLASIVYRDRVKKKETLPVRYSFENQSRHLFRNLLHKRTFEHSIRTQAI